MRNFDVYACCTFVLVLTSPRFREFNEETANLFAAHLETMKEELSSHYPKNAVYIRSGA